jgi:hypothetical protein
MGVNQNQQTAEPSISAADTQPTLHDLERIIEEGEARRKASYRETGKALHEIKSRGLFKETHRTWQDYVTKRWGFSRQRAHQLMQAWMEAEMSTAVDIAKTEREARRRRQRKSTRASNKISSLPDDYNSMPTGIVSTLEAEIEAFERQMSRWQKFLCKEDSITLLEKINKIIEARLVALNNRFDEEVAA